MLSTARAAQKLIQASKDPSTILKLPPQNLPATTTFADLESELAHGNVDKQKRLESLVIILSLVSEPYRISRKGDDEDPIRELSIWVANAILPSQDAMSYDDISENQDGGAIEALNLTKSLALHGLLCLTALETFSASPPGDINPKILLSAVVFSSPQDVWASRRISQLAQTFLSQHETQRSSSVFIVNYLLQSFIRPLFSKSRPSTVTATGRKAMPTSQPMKMHEFEAEKRDKPWKYEAVYTLAVFSWIVEHSSQEIVKAHWNLFTPPLLTLLDDPSTPIRTCGLSLLSTFLPLFPPSLLSQTGLAPVFEDAIFPTLMFVPTLTPLSESLILLPAAYQALYVLADVRFSAVEEREKDTERIKSLDKIMRKGILPAYHHAFEHTLIVQLLLAQTSTLFGKLGIHSVKHLKDTIPILESVLTDPFATPTSIHSALQALLSVIQNAWPRIGEDVHRITIMKALVVCWENLDGLADGAKEGQGVKEEMSKVGRLFISVLGADDGAREKVRGEIQKLVDVDPTLEDLFGVQNAVE